MLPSTRLVILREHAGALLSDRGCPLDATGALNIVSAEQISPHNASLMFSLLPYLSQIEADC